MRERLREREREGKLHNEEFYNLKALKYVTERIAGKNVCVIWDLIRNAY